MNTHFTAIEQLYRTMDLAWDKVAAEYGFQCNGCKDNCCLSLFFHHTHVEKDYLRNGFSALPHSDKQEIQEKARRYCATTFGPETGTNPVSRKAPCPLLHNGRCRLYKFRPMICRMHGLPHELHTPAGLVKGPGCDAGCFEGHRYIPLDRTPFYREMSGIEMRYREATGKMHKTKQTIAQILLHDL